ncbi:hypothetical protein LTR28_014049 [Elasticomyces elasticus]|nr:hypothetical protein LTR28_014049 [Elasticomyces elasticus]
MIRRELSPIIFVICNEGFTIERFIHGMDAAYNDIQPWNYKDLVPAFGAKAGRYQTHQVRTKRQVEALFGDEGFNTARVLRFVEIYMPKEDAPVALRLVAEASARNNAKQ